jgi:hypothetical protein
MKKEEEMKRMIAVLSTISLVFVGAGMSVAWAGSSGPEIDSSGATITMAKTTFTAAACTGEEMIGGVETSENYETLTGNWDGNITDMMVGDTLDSPLTGKFDIDNLVWTINENPAQPHGNSWTGVLRGDAEIITNAGVTIDGPLTLITQNEPGDTGSTQSQPVEARGWMDGDSISNAKGPLPGSYLLNLAFKINSDYSAAGRWGNTGLGYGPWGVYDSDVACS